MIHQVSFGISENLKNNDNMEIQNINESIAEIVADDIVIHSTDDGLDILGNVYYQGFDKVILYEKNISADFFNLKTKMAGEILQKFSNYRMRLAIIGDFNYESNSLKEFITESNKLKSVNFVNTRQEAIEALSN